jgi:hypothetical protein
MISRLHRGHAFTHFNNDSSTFVSQYGWERALWVVARQGEGVSMADTRGFYFDHNLASAWSLNVHLRNL